MSNSLAIYLGGFHALAFGMFHLLFWKLFRWRAELPKLHIANRAILQIANVQLIGFFIVVGVLCFLFNADLANTPLGHGVLFCISAWWLLRFVGQFVFLRVNDGRVHVLSGVFLIGSFLFAWPILNGSPIPSH